MTDTYSNVDASADVQAALDWQDRVDAWPQVRAYKDHSFARVEGLRPLLDVGCGTGSDLVTIGAGAVGIDRSRAMTGRAHERGCAVLCADAQRIPFASGTFGAVRADRVLQHLSEPLDALAEMSRVTRAGGRVTVADPDQGSLVIHAPGVRPELTDRVRRLRQDVGYRNGRLASTLPAAFARAGLVDITVRAFPLALTDPDDAFGLPGWVTYWRERGHPFEDADEAEWADGMVQARDGGFVYALLYFVVDGTVP